MKLIIATSNEGKLLEFREALRETDFEVVPASDMGVTDFPEETGDSYQANAMIKAKYAAKQTGLPALADDSGLEVDALSGEPGIYSARYGDKSSAAERNALLLSKLERTPPGGRTARFICSLVLVTPKGGAVAFEGRAEGEISAVPHGKAGFGYDPIFFSHDLYKSFAEATLEEKQPVSHRGRALDGLLAWLESDEAEDFFGNE